MLSFIWGIEAQKQLEVTINSSTKVTPDGEGGLYFAGTKDVNYRFGKRISPHGDCLDVVNGYAFVTWYKGGMDTRNLMLSRRNLNIANSPWVTIEFPHKHVGQGGEILNGTGIRGDSHNTAAIGISTIDNTIHILYDMHAYRESNLPNDFFNYSVSVANSAFVPDAQFNLSIFNPKQNYLKLGQDYNRITYPMIHRANDGSLVARYRIGGSGNGDIFMAHYNGSTWTNNWLYHEGTLPVPDRNNMYGGERFLNGKFYSGFSIRYSTNNDTETSNGYMLNSGLYFAYTNDIPKNQSSQWFDVYDNPISIPIQNNIHPNPDPVKIAEPGEDFGTASQPRTSSDPSWTVTESGAIHFVTRVDNINVHYYKGPGDSNFSSNAGGLIPNPDTRGELYSYKNHVFMVELLSGKVNIKTTLEGTNDWKIIYTETDSISYNHFDAFVAGNKLYVYLMEDTGNNTPGVGDKRPLYFKEFTLSELDVPNPVKIKIEAEDYDAGGQDVGYNDISVGNSGGVYKSDDVDIEASLTASNGFVVVHFQGSEWLQYTFQVDTPGTYDFIITAANRNRDDSIMDIDINGTLYEGVNITRTFDWEVFGESKIQNIILNQGANIVRITQRRSLSSTPDKLEFVLTSALSINDFEQNPVSIYPNPSKGIFSIVSNLQNVKYRLVNMQGQVLIKGDVSQKEVDLSNYTNGIYFLEFTVNNSHIVSKIVLK